MKNDSYFINALAHVFVIFHIIQEKLLNSVETLHCFQLSYFAQAAARALRRLRY